MRRAIGWPAAVLLIACGSPPPPAPYEVHVRLPAGASTLRWEPTRAAEQEERGPVTILRFAEAPGALTLRADGACPASVAAGEHGVELAPWIDVDPSALAQIGFDAPIAIEVRPGCREAITGHVEWEVTGGAPLAQMTTERRGFLLRGRTAPFSAERREGLIAFSPRTAARTELTLRWQGPGAPPITRRVHLAATARATGLSSVPLGHRVWLGGTWTIAERPREARATLEPQLDLQTFLPDRPGPWRLRGAGGRELLLRVGRYDEVPLDCGRSECHSQAASAVLESPMTRALASRASEELDAGCAMECHTIGEPGTPDGGFAHVARELGLDARAQARAPRAPALSRLHGVGCVACHGPAAIPDAQARWAVLRSDVCAVCHDAPPRYGHVEAWRRSAMARSGVIEGGECAGCHTTDGFLRRIGARSSESRPPPESAIGIACAACHAPHGEHVGTALVRDVPIASYIGAEIPPSSRVCVACHAPASADGPGPTSAAIWLGRGGAGEDGAAIEMAPVHASIGCMGCHRGGPSELERGASHSFEIDRQSCLPCHEDRVDAAREESRLLRERARAILGAQAGPHPAGASRNARLVLGDPAPAAHHAAYARLLLSSEAHDE